MNMIDYLKWRGDLSFQQDEFNEVDNLILSYISYVDFIGVFQQEDEVLTLKEASDRFYQLHTLQEVNNNKSFIAKAPIVMLEASKTNRFGNLPVHDYVDILQPENIRQFSAIQFDITDNTTYVAFRGTDDTMIGWQEDLLLSYKVILSQKDSSDYINTHLNCQKKYYIGGHSKGGCLALYGASCCDEKWKKQFIQVFNNDGPNLSSKLIEQEMIDSILPITTRYIPGFSVFGMIYADTPYKDVVVKSDGVLIMQHDPMLWQIEGKRFISLDKVSNESVFIKHQLDDFINNTDDQQKEVFVKELFNALDDAKIDKVSTIAEEGLPGIIKIIKEVSEINETAKFVGNKLINILKQLSAAEVIMLRENTSDYIKDKVNDVQTFINLKVNDVNEFIDEKKSDIIQKIKKGKNE